MKLLVITETGTVQTLYSDELAKIFPGAKQKITRASNVEPSSDGNGWDVVLTDSPLNGPYRGHVVARNVPLREDALRLEVDFIQTHILGVTHAKDTVEHG